MSLFNYSCVCGYLTSWQQEFCSVNGKLGMYSEDPCVVALLAMFHAPHPALCLHEGGQLLCTSNYETGLHSMWGDYQSLLKYYS